MYQQVLTECLPELILGFLAARIDDCDEGYEHDDWQIESGPQNRTVSYPLRADRWWRKAGALDEGEDVGRCLGIRCNIWARAMRRREITHNLRGGGKENIGWGALMWQDMVSTGAVRFGTLEILRYLSLPPQENHKFSARVLFLLGLVSEPESARIAHRSEPY